VIFLTRAQNALTEKERELLLYLKKELNPGKDKELLQSLKKELRRVAVRSHKQSLCGIIY